MQRALPLDRKRVPSLYDDDEEGEGQNESEQAGPAAAKKPRDEPPVQSDAESSSNGRNKEDEIKEEKQIIESEDVPNKDPSLFSVIGTRKGEREDMQDAHLAIDHFEFECKGVKRSALYAIFDGHSGARAAEFCRDKLPDVLKKKLSSYDDVSNLEKSLKKIFTESFKAIDDRFLNIARSNKPVWRDGATATVIFLLNNVIYVSNLGDSRAVVGRVKSETPGIAQSKEEKEKMSAIQLSIDHNPSAYDERMRIQKTGATVKDGRVNGIIEVSRSIGDGAYKSLGVSCIPDMKRLTLTQNDRLLIVACDGLWKTFDNEEAIKFALDKVTEFEKSDIAEELGERREQTVWRLAAESMAAEAVKRKCGDNVSVLLLPLSPYISIA